MSGILRFLMSLILIGAGAAAIWWIQFRPQAPQATQAQVQVPSFEQESIKSVLGQVDTQVAGVIRGFGDGDFSLPKLQVGSAMETTISAKFSTTPDQLLKQIREEGAQAALGTVAKNVEMQVGDVSSEFVDQARYQYCKGVVESYESRAR